MFADDGVFSAGRQDASKESGAMRAALGEGLALRVDVISSSKVIHALL